MDESDPSNSNSNRKGYASGGFPHKRQQYFDCGDGTNGRGVTIFNPNGVNDGAEQLSECSDDGRNCRDNDNDESDTLPARATSVDGMGTISCRDVENHEDSSSNNNDNEQQAHDTDNTNDQPTPKIKTKRPSCRAPLCHELKEAAIETDINSSIHDKVRKNATGLSLAEELINKEKVPLLDQHENNTNTDSNDQMLLQHQQLQHVGDYEQVKQVNDGTSTKAAKQKEINSEELQKKTQRCTGTTIESLGVSTLTLNEDDDGDEAQKFLKSSRCIDFEPESLNFTSMIKSERQSVNSSTRRGGITSSVITLKSTLECGLDLDDINAIATDTKIQDWIRSFYHLDPRWQILTFFNDLALEGTNHSESNNFLISQEKKLLMPLMLRAFSRAGVFSVWRPTSSDAIRKMITGEGTGKGLDIKGKSAKCGKYSG